MFYIIPIIYFPKNKIEEEEEEYVFYIINHFYLLFNSV